MSRIASTIAVCVALGVAFMPAPTATASQTVDVTVQDCPECPALFRFSPGSITIDVGDTVRWSNPTSQQHTITENTTCEPHTASPPFLPKPAACVFDSSLVNTGGVFQHRFTAPGVFEYHCDVHHFAARVTVVGTALPDLVPDAPFIHDTAAFGVALPSPKHVDVRIHNTGVAGAGGSTLSVGYMHKGTYHPIKSNVAVDPIPAGASRLMHIVWDVAGTPGGTPTALLGDFTVVATVDPVGGVAEADETNNVASAVVTVGPVAGVAGVDLFDP